MRFLSVFTILKVLIRSQLHKSEGNIFMQLTLSLIILKLYVPSPIPLHCHHLWSSNHRLQYSPRLRPLCAIWPFCFLLTFYYLQSLPSQSLEWKILNAYYGLWCPTWTGHHYTSNDNLHAAYPPSFYHLPLIQKFWNLCTEHSLLHFFTFSFPAGIFVYLRRSLFLPSNACILFHCILLAVVFLFVFAYCLM